MNLLTQPLKDAVAKKSDTTGWDNLVKLDRAAPELRIECEKLWLIRNSSRNSTKPASR